ncbi:MAG: hypothetical protein IKE61_06490 [Coriobacteriales bacterium]|nr:hypothetical protein [Coriobacteriales bacterium]
MPDDYDSYGLNYASWDDGQEVGPPDSYYDYGSGSRRGKRLSLWTDADERRWQAAEKRRQDREKEIHDLLYGGDDDDDDDYDDYDEGEGDEDY